MNRGEFDRILVRPVPILTQVLGSRVGMNGFGNIILGAVLITQSLAHMRVDWVPLKAGFALLILISAVAVRMSIYLAAQSASCWLKADNFSLPFMVHTVVDFAKYPLNLFPPAVKAVICVAVPYAFVSYFPATFIFGKEGQAIGWCTPIAAIICIYAATGVFYLGMRVYDSTGN